eukprot:3991861-Heterocapsa_arctica.AAC.1
MFGQQEGEDVDDVLSRFDILMHRAMNEAGLDLGPSGFSWILLNGMRVPTDEWVALLIPFLGVLPSTEAELTQLLQLVRRYGRLRQAS